MSPELATLFSQIADLPREQRDRFYAEQQVSPEMRRELESLLQFDRAVPTESFQGLVSGAAAAWSNESGSAPEFCGPYRLVRLLGQGGMGAVYLGERQDNEVKLQVAVKLVHASGAQDFAQRFLTERQILASIKHPGIARLLDAGRTAGSGIPYLVMEFVDGEPLHLHCQALTLEAILRLFLDVCDAVAYLHRNLVVHRDLKPSNILVERESGRVKLLDFGIAKILDDAAAHAGLTRERLLTPEYASPEQANGLATTTATDIYSLGAVLRKVTGTLVEGQSGSLATDTDAIMQKCMRQEPASRYATADALADDIRAALESRPVKARAGNRWYRTNRFLRRHWALTLAVVTALLSLTGGVVYSNRERTLADERFKQVRALAATVFRFDESLRDLPGSTKAREQLVTASLAYLDGLDRDASLERDPALAWEVANGYKLVARVQGAPRSANLGKLGPAQSNLEKAARIVERRLARGPEDRATLLLGLEIAADLASIGDTKDADDYVLQQSGIAANYSGRLMKMGLQQESDKQQAVEALLGVGGACSNMQILDQAATHLELGAGLARPLAASATKVQVLSTLAQVRRRLGQLNEASALLDEAEAVHQRAQYESGRARVNAEYSLLIRRGGLLGEDESISLGRRSEAVKPLEEAMKLAEEWLAKDPHDASSLTRIIRGGRVLGDILRHLDPQKSLQVYERSLECARRLGGVPGKRDEARLLARTSVPLRKLGHTIEASRRIEQAVGILRELRQYPPARGEFSAELDGVMRILAEHEFETGSFESSRQTWQRLIGWSDDAKMTPSTLVLAHDLSAMYRGARRPALRLGLVDEVSKLDERRRRIWVEWNQKLPGNAYVQSKLREP